VSGAQWVLPILLSGGWCACCTAAIHAHEQLFTFTKLSQTPSSQQLQGWHDACFCSLTLLTSASIDKIG
jgi:hypothetical protein